MVVVNSGFKSRFTDPNGARRRRQGGCVSRHNWGFGKESELVNKGDGGVDFNNMLFQDKSRNILAKQNVQGVRR